MAYSYTFKPLHMHLGDMPGPDLVPVHGERGEAQALLVRVDALRKTPDY